MLELAVISNFRKQDTGTNNGTGHSKHCCSHCTVDHVSPYYLAALQAVHAISTSRKLRYIYAPQDSTNPYTKSDAGMSSLLPIHTPAPSVPISRQNLLLQYQRSHTWSLHTTIMLEELASAAHFNSRGKR
jgi:hypothetical protein